MTYIPFADLGYPDADGAALQNAQAQAAQAMHDNSDAAANRRDDPLPASRYANARGNIPQPRWCADFMPVLELMSRVAFDDPNEWLWCDPAQWYATSTVICTAVYRRELRAWGRGGEVWSGIKTGSSGHQPIPPSDFDPGVTSLALDTSSPHNWQVWLMLRQDQNVWDFKHRNRGWTDIGFVRSEAMQWLDQRRSWRVRLRRLAQWWSGG